MGDKSRIEWTDATWNPVTGCDRISPGCDNCYALDLAARLKAMGNPRYQQDGLPPRSGPGFGVTLHEDVLSLPLRWKRPRRVFVNSMSDLFHEEVPGGFILDVFEAMRRARRHVFQVLTKRPRRMESFLRQTHCNGQDDGGQLPNVWLGTSVEDQRWADVRVPSLLRTPATIRFLSVEPMLSSVSVAEWLAPRTITTNTTNIGPWPGVSWVICGAESGPRRRPFDLDWARGLRDECLAAGVPFFFKQGPAFKPGQNRVLDGRTWDEMPHSAQVEMVIE